MQTNLLVVVALLLVAWLLLRRRGQQKKEKSTPDVPEQKQSVYHAVSIKHGTRACAAAQTLAGRRFLSNAAPRLPLPECDAPECSCRFVHHDDRRSGKDRRSPFAPAGFGGGTGSFQKERRERPERRKDADADLY